MEAIGFNLGPNSVDVIPEESGNGYNISAFKITPGPIRTVRSPVRLGSAPLEIRFSSQTIVNISVLLFCLLRVAIQIDRYMNSIPKN